MRELSLIEKLTQIRKSKGIKQSFVADYLGITQASYSRIETGKAQLSICYAEKIARCLGTKLKIEIEG